MKNTAVVCLGGNAPESEVRIRDAVAFLCALGAVGRSSGMYATEPEYAGEKEPYLNMVVELETQAGYDTLRTESKRYESGIRADNKSEGLVNLDIDVVLWNGEVMRPKDAAASFFRKGIALIQRSSE